MSEQVPTSEEVRDMWLTHHDHRLEALSRQMWSLSLGLVVLGVLVVLCTQRKEQA